MSLKMIEIMQDYVYMLTGGFTPQLIIKPLANYWERYQIDLRDD